MGAKGSTGPVLPPREAFVRRGLAFLYARERLLLSRREALAFSKNSAAEAPVDPNCREGKMLAAIWDGMQPPAPVSRSRTAEGKPEERA